MHGTRQFGLRPRFVWLIAGGLALLIGLGADAAPKPVPLRRSEQFSVIDARPIFAISSRQFQSASGEDLVRLNVDVLLLSAERVKELLLGELQLAANRHAKIHLVLYPAAQADEIIGVVSSITPDGWEYRVQVPDQLEARQLVRGIVHVLLLEIANRGQGGKSAELPLWLVEGLTAHLLAMAGEDLVVGSVPLGSMLRTVRERRGLDYLQNTREVLRSAPLLSFSALAYPRATQLSGEPLKVFQCSAHLFVYELLQIKNGAGSVVAMLRGLPSCWNWEIALLGAFPTEFKRMLDVEKKWSVDVLAFTERDPTQVWSRVQCLERLDQLLAIPAQVRVSSDTLPERRMLTLQQVIGTWEFSAQASVIQQRLPLLEVLLSATRIETNRSARLVMREPTAAGAARLQSSEDLLPVLEGYYQSLAVYLHKRALAGREPDNRMQIRVNASLVAQQAIRELDELDQRREALRPENLLSRNSPITR